MVPAIAVVIPTRNRGADAAEAARAVLRSDADLELVVVDQSTDERTLEALNEITDARLTVVRSTKRGISNARNDGVAATTAPIIAFTDDDCRPRADWAASMIDVFTSDPRASVVFGKVSLPETGEHDFAAAFTPTQRIQEGRVMRPSDDMGVGASLAIRRDILQDIGGFDPLLGAGAPIFRGAEETDVLIQVLHRGLRVVNSDDSDVLHLGIRRGDEVKALVVAYQRATGAAFAKHGRLDGRRGWADVARWFSDECRVIVRELVRGRRPHPGPALHFATGVVGSFRYRVDRSTRRFAERGRRGTAQAGG